ncbi:MAG: menaquinone biosynthetic enzyme MqnA/MqnD family protein [Fimbriimonadaceae bacterium]
MKVGAVRYLNAFPLWRCVEGVRLGTPNQLSEWLEVGSVDAALTSSIEAFRSGRRILGGYGVCACGPVESVLLLGDLGASGATFAPDPHSRTSNALARIILAQRYGIHPAIAPAAEADLRVVIGDPALKLDTDRGPYLDLGREWQELTQLPFVFAVWITRTGESRSTLRPQIELSLDAPALLEEAATRYSDFNKETIDRYLSKTLYYRWSQPAQTSPEWESLQKFYSLAKEFEPDLTAPLLDQETTDPQVS